MTSSNSPRLPASNPLPEQFLLEASYYVDPSWAEQEQQQIFRQSWLYAGDRTQLSPGQVWSTEVAAQPILITCDGNGQLRAFHNVCAHRAAALCPQARVQTCSRLICPYHAWVYDLQGQLRGVPSHHDFPPGFAPQALSLRAIALETWCDFIFVCMAEDPPPLAEYLGLVAYQAGQHRRAETQYLFGRSRTVACNWKNYHDRRLCDYHGAIGKQTAPGIAQGQRLPPLPGPGQHYGHQFGFYTNLLHRPITPIWRAENPILAGLSDFAGENFLTYGIFPNLHLLAQPNGVLGWLRIDPISPTSCQVNLEVYGIPGCSPPLEQLRAEFDAFMAEDVVLVESVQRGYVSGAYRPGPVNQLEARIVHQQQLIADRLRAASS